MQNLSSSAHSISTAERLPDGSGILCARVRRYSGQPVQMLSDAPWLTAPKNKPVNQFKIILQKTVLSAFERSISSW